MRSSFILGFWNVEDPVRAKLKPSVSGLETEFSGKVVALNVDAAIACAFEQLFFSTIEKRLK